MNGIRRTWIVAPLVALMVSACASGGASKAAGPSRSQSELAAEEIARAGFNDAYSTIQSLRPQWLSVRGAVSFSAKGNSTVKVYLDGNLLGTVDNLRQLPTSSIASIKHLDGMEASNRYGLDHGAGAILITSKGGR